jgi:type I restriction enzyme, S subunit
MPIDEVKMLRWAHLPECRTEVAGWKVANFCEVAQVIAGQSPPSDTYNDKEHGIPFLQGNADFCSIYPEPRLWCTSPVKKASSGDTLISVRAPVGEINRADRDYAIGRGLAAVRATTINPDFLFHALQRWKWCLQRVAQGTTFDAVTARHFARLYVFVPETLDEQVAIARILNHMDKVIHDTEEAVKRTQALKTAVIQDFFYSAIGETAYADRPAKRLPHGWALVPTATLLAGEPKNGISPTASTQPPGIPTFSIGAIRNSRIDLENDNHLKYVRISNKMATKFQVRSGDVLIVRGNANPDLVGKAGVIKKFPSGCIYPDIAKRVVFKKSGEHVVSPEFAVITWNHSIVHNQVLRRAKTSNGTLKINNRDVKQIIMPVPTAREQATLVETVAAVELKIDELVYFLNSYEDLKRALRHDLLTGQVTTLNAYSHPLGAA